MHGRPHRVSRFTFHASHFTPISLFPLRVRRDYSCCAMAVLCRWILVLTMLLAAGPRLVAASAADRVFDAAAKAFQDTFYDRAEAGFSDFCKNNPTSPRLAAAILLQAEARVELSNYAGAIALISAHQQDAGTNAD